MVVSTMGKKQNALDDFNQALVLYRNEADRFGEAAVLNNIGVVHKRVAFAPALAVVLSIACFSIGSQEPATRPAATPDAVQSLRSFKWRRQPDRSNSKMVAIDRML